jgi:hypothetical protein
MSLLTMMITSEKATQKSMSLSLRSVHHANFLQRVAMMLRRVS